MLALTVREVEDAWMVAALGGFHGWALRADRNRRNACEETGIPAL